MKAKDLCMKAYGEKHLLACRLYLNIGILYEDNRDFEVAYDHFVKWNEVCLAVSNSFNNYSSFIHLTDPSSVLIRYRTYSFGYLNSGIFLRAEALAETGGSDQKNVKTVEISEIIEQMPKEYAF